MGTKPLDHFGRTRSADSWFITYQFHPEQHERIICQQPVSAINWDAGWQLANDVGLYVRLRWYCASASWGQGWYQCFQEGDLKRASGLDWSLSGTVPVPICSEQHWVLHLYLQFLMDSPSINSYKHLRTQLSQFCQKKNSRSSILPKELEEQIFHSEPVLHQVNWRTSHMTYAYW